MLLLIFKINLVILFSLVIIEAAFDEVAPAVYVNVEVLIQFQHAFKYLKFLFHRLVADVEFIFQRYGISLCILVPEFAEGFLLFRFRKQAFGKIIHLKVLIVFEIVARTIQQVDGIGAGETEFNRGFLCNKLARQADVMARIEVVVFDRAQAQEFIFPEGALVFF